MLLIRVRRLFPATRASVSPDAAIDRLRRRLLVMRRMMLRDGRGVGRIVVRVVVVRRRTGRRETGMVVDR